MNKKLFIVVNVDWFFLSHRKEIAIVAQKKGFDVTIVTCNTGRRTEIEYLGLDFIDLPLSKSGKNIVQELRSLFFLIYLYKKYKPDIVHHVGVKTILYGTLAAKIVHVKSIVNAVSGLGIFFSNEKKSIISNLVVQIFRFSHKQKNIVVIFQNDEDKTFFLKNKIIKSDQACTIKGSGIDLHIFNYMPESEDTILRILFTARMIKEKGVFELVNAARILKKKYQNMIQFVLCGWIDDNPQAIKKEELEKLTDESYIIWLGYRTNIRELLEKAHIVAFPSYYREGLPKSLIEACAIGRPIVTTDSIGCKDVVVNGYNGFLVPVKDSKSLAEKLEVLINDKALRMSMGKNARKTAERDFSIEHVIEKHMAIYTKLIQ